MHVVRSALRNGIYQRAREVAIPHVVRREQHLIFLDGVDRDGLAAGDTGERAIPIEESLTDAVDEITVEPEADPAPRNPAESGADLRDEPREIEYVAIERRHLPKERIRDHRRRPGARVQ